MLFKIKDAKVSLKMLLSYILAEDSEKPAFKVGKSSSVLTGGNRAFAVFICTAF